VLPSHRREERSRTACAAGPGGEEADDSLQFDMKAAVLRLEAALAGSPQDWQEMEEEELTLQGLPVWCHSNAMLPGFREILGVHQPWLIAMFNKLLKRPRPWRYVHFSNSSSFAQDDSTKFTVNALYNTRKDGDSAIRPKSDPSRPAVGTMMEVVLADRADDGRLYLAVRALGPVTLQRIVQTNPNLRAVVEWRPDAEEIEEGGGEAPAACSGEIWACNFESKLNPEEFEGLRPISQHLVEVAKRFHELAPAGGDAAATAAEADETAAMVSTPAQRSLAMASRGQGVPEEVTSAVWTTISRIEELQEAIDQQARSASAPAPAPTAAKAMRRLVKPQIARALGPLLEEGSPEWGPTRRARWLSYAIAAMLPEVSMGPGRQALLEAPSVAARLGLCYEVLAMRRESLSALLALQQLESSEEEEEAGRAGERQAASSSGEAPPANEGLTLQEAARLERSLGGGLHLSSESDAAAALQREKRRKRLRWLQQRAIQEAAECTLLNDGDESLCEREWKAVKDLSDLSSLDDISIDDGEDPLGR